MFLLAFRFYIINCNRRWMKPKSNHLSQRKGSLATSQIQAKGNKVASIAITTTSTTTVVQVKVQLVKSIPFIVLPKYIPQENQRSSEHRGENKIEKS